MKYNFYSLLIVLALMLVGCQKRRDDEGEQAARPGRQNKSIARSPFVRDECEHVCMIVLDLSGSFKDKMAAKGIAYDFVNRVIAKCFKDRVSCSTDRIVLAGISGTSKSILWEGTPGQLRRKFANPEAFRDFLYASADPNGSLVNEGLARSIEYLSRMQCVSSGRAKSILLILSDMEDNGPNREATEQRLVNSLVSYLNQRGHCGFYFVSQDPMEHWQARLTAEGFPLIPILTDKRDLPTLPDFQ